jgi:predicted sugar kinase
VQGGVYACPEVASAVAWLRDQGIAGAGQSSWGPGVFGIAEGEEKGAWLLDRARAEFPSARVWLTSARNRGDLAIEHG